MNCELKLTGCHGDCDGMVVSFLRGRYYRCCDACYQKIEMVATAIRLDEVDQDPPFNAYEIEEAYKTLTSSTLH